ncbi:MAG: hypothetical protein IPK39_23280 [Sulfuritalea sp.]|nr:hypothetical protein [Sulfuritalea sp.]
MDAGGEKTAPARNGRCESISGKTDIYLLNGGWHREDGKRVADHWLASQDTKADEVLHRYVDFGAGMLVKTTENGDRHEIWLQSWHCTDGQGNDSDMWQFTKKFSRKMSTVKPV